ncbi:unnamed protein product [Arctogadus glacialis]
MRDRAKKERDVQRARRPARAVVEATNGQQEGKGERRESRKNRRERSGETLHPPDAPAGLIPVPRGGEHAWEAASRKQNDSRPTDGEDIRVDQRLGPRTFGVEGTAHKMSSEAYTGIEALRGATMRGRCCLGVISPPTPDCGRTPEPRAPPRPPPPYPSLFISFPLNAGALAVGASQPASSLSEPRRSAHYGLMKTGAGLLRVLSPPPWQLRTTQGPL